MEGNLVSELDRIFKQHCELPNVTIHGDGVEATVDASFPTHTSAWTIFNSLTQAHNIVVTVGASGSDKLILSLSEGI